MKTTHFRFVVSLFFCSVFALTSIFSTTSPALGYTVDSSPRVGLNGNACAYTTIQEAINAAVSGDMVYLQQDTFAENVDITGKDLTLIGGSNPDCSPFDSGRTIIQGDGAGSVIDIANSDTILRNLDITGGSTDFGGGVDLSGTSEVVLDDVAIFNNTALMGGGIFVPENSILTLTNGSEIRYNTASVFGGGAYVWGMLAVNDSYSSISWNTAPSGGGIALRGGTLDFHGNINRNEASSVDGLGGGIYATEGSVISHVNSVIYNHAYNGGGIYADSSTIQLGGGVFDNSASNSGGGFYLANNSTMTGSSSALIGTISAHGNRAINRGGGIYLDHSSLDYSGKFQQNSASDGGGAIYASESSITLSGVEFYYNSSTNGGGISLAGGILSGENCLFLNNNADSDASDNGAGGAIYNDNGVVYFTQTVFHHNLSPRGGAIYQQGASAETNLSNNLIVSNTSLTDNGAGIRSESGAFILTQTTIANNVGGSGFLGAATQVTNSIIWGNATGGMTTIPTSYSCNIDESGLAGLNIDPLFSNPGSIDGHLQKDSPAVDACETGLEIDLEFSHRPSGQYYDMGAYEYQFPVIFIPMVSRP